MQFLTNEESARWCNDHNIALSSNGKPIITKTDLQVITFPYPEYTGFVFLAKTLASSVLFGKESLLWITTTMVWPSSENIHLYYKLRQSYSNFDLVMKKPGHLFEEHELDDLVSFLHLSLLFGWDCYLLSANDNTRAFCSNDEMINLCSNDHNCVQIVNSSFINRKPAG
jgi:hypothetical protein